jgi:hypothetical protein
MKSSRKRLRTEDSDFDAAPVDDGGDDELDRQLQPVADFVVNAEDRRLLENLEIDEVDPEHYDDVGNDALLDAGLNAHV